ncbi:MAG: putative amidohydrolase YtcJ [Granulosicoccus sp.]|jgi:predicted amidohydrolase YtcJ
MSDSNADLIIVNGKLLIADGTASALAISGGTIVAVGSDAEMDGLRGSRTQVIDAEGNSVLPGFIESHVHLFSGGAELDLLNLMDCHCQDQFNQLARKYSGENPNSAMLLAIGADYQMLGHNITRHDLDQALPDRPFAIMAMDHHTVWANTKALELVGIEHGAPVTFGSQITLDSDGVATGELLESGAFEYILAKTPLGGRDALGLVTGADPVPPATFEQRAADKAALRAGLNHLAKNGITTFHNMDGNFYQLELLSELEADGDLLCRGQIPFHLKNFDPIDRLAEADEMRQRYNSDWLWSNRLKLFHDGVIESGTAAMLEPYPNWPDSTGLPLFEPEQFNEICVRADAMGLQISVHAIGDAAVRGTLDGYEAARDANGLRDSRHRVEHIEVMHPDDLPRIAGLDVIASMQPLHSPAGGLLPLMEDGEILHDHQKPMAFPWKAVRDSGAKLIFSSDWPVVPVDVMPGVAGAVSPIDLGGNWADNSQGLIETLESYTSGGAYAEFNEARKGRLVSGMMADVVIMSDDLVAMAPDQLGTAKPVTTICGGRVTYEARK